MTEQTATIDGVEIRWDLARGRMESIGHSLAAFWLDPSLLNLLRPLRDELGTELFSLVVAHASSQGTKEDYEKMVTVFADTFEEGFLAWGRAVGVVGWGRFELLAMDRTAGTGRVIVRAPWELVMQERIDDKWGCPFMRGKLIGIFRNALGVNCWAEERTWVEDDEPVVEFTLYQSDLTIDSEVDRLRAELATKEAQQLQAVVEHRTELHRASEERLRATLSSMSSWVFTLGDQRRITSSYVPHHDARGRWPTGDLIGRRLRDVLSPDAAEKIHLAAEAVLENGRTASATYHLPDGDEVSTYEATLSPMRDAAERITAVTVVVRDTTVQHRAREHQEQLAAQLRQAQKMEAIGQLTGGVAHDFNNILTAIFGNLDLARSGQIDDETASFIDDARTAAESAAMLTHRLLAFARLQPLQPNRVDPRRLITGMEVLLRRTLGESVDIEVVGSAGQWECEVDEPQLESAILNLAINARDAMPQGGKITIETSNIRIGPEYAEVHSLVPGQYVLVAVSDTGVGMTDEVRQKAFEPFFTTKGLGKGSGLGLSMVYGFIRQSNGHIAIYSEPGLGTTIKIYLPRSTDRTPTRAALGRSGPAPDGDGSLVLVVEDDEPVRNVSVRLLREIGYRTLGCASAAEALQVLASDAPIDLLFTDVVLPGEMNGRKLAQAASAIRPNVAVLFTSGYTENAIVHQGRLEPDVQLLEKPFTKELLARHVFRALHRSRTGEDPETTTVA